ncbi:hypothetical protein MLGJGCBP_03002 [Rhodococcus sp. T7]|nr:hypothetical protein MLGJGCBP_03002 [Rhodococcus sp. T7]
MVESRGRGESGDGSVVEYVSGREDHTGSSCAGHQLDGQDAVAAEGEERIVRADRIQSEHVLEQSGEKFLDLGLRRPASGTGEVGCRKGCAVELSVNGQGKRVEYHERGRNQVRRQPAGGEVEECPRIDRCTGFGHHVPDQPVADAVGVPHARRRVGHGVVGEQRRLHLAEFDPEAPDLHLGVGAPEVLQLPVGEPARPVPGAIHPAARWTERIGDEAFGGERVPPAVAACKGRTCEVQLSGDAGRYRVQS